MFEFKGIKQAKSQSNIPTDENGIVYVVQSMSNNMVSRKVNRQYLIDIDEAPVEGNCIVLGVTLPAISYQPNEFGASQVITARAPFLNNKNSLFFVNIINKHMYQFSYQNKPGIEIYKNLNIQLPITSTGEIDFAFMENFISELEEERISELNAYLEVTGLKDYTLTPEEEIALQEFSNITWEDFNVVDLFRVKNTHNILSSEIIENSGEVPYLCASAENNAVSSYIKYNEDFLDEGNCIFIGGKTFVVSYQENDFFSNDSHNLALYHKKAELRNLKNQLFLSTCIKRSLQHLYSWGDSISNKKIQKDVIKLPIKNNSPDYSTMETFISAIQKLVIKDVVLYADKKINATKNIVNNS